jgi:hypothetical protein
MNGRFHKNKKRTNLSILSQTLKEVIKDENLQKEPPKVEQVISTGKVSKELSKCSRMGAQSQSDSMPRMKPKAAKREVPIEGNGIIEKAMKKKPLQFINFKSLLTG